MKKFGLYRLQGTTFFETFPCEFMNSPTFEIWFQSTEGECVSTAIEWDFWSYT